ncbi:hypothetical protein PGB90_009191 [Kerria lacca]
MSGDAKFCSEQDKEEIKTFVNCIFKRWFGLQAAISNGMGGTAQQTHMKLSHMIDSIADMCCIKDLMKDDLVNALEDFTDEYFNTEFEDGSIEEVASDLWKRSRSWLDGNKEVIRSFVAINNTFKNENQVPELINLVNENMDIDSEFEEDKYGNTESSTSDIVNLVRTDNDDWIVPRYSRRRNK